MYVNNFDKDGTCARQGQSAEDSFEKLLIKRGTVRKASVGEQRKHVDFFLTNLEGKIISYDVKALKKTNRSDSDTSDELIWIEFLAISGNDGWLRAKNCDFIAFEQKDSFIVVNRDKLQSLCENLTLNGKLVKSSSQALYNFYQRYGRKDLLSLIKTSDVISIADEVITKIN